jgi:hypothetical protein
MDVEQKQRARRGETPSTGVLRERFEAWAADRFARLAAEGGIDPGEVIGIRVRPVDGMHEIIVDTTSGAVVLGQVPILELAIANGALADEYLQELSGRVALRRGRPPGQTSIKDDEVLRGALAEMDRDERDVRRDTLAAAAGYTVDELRGYLKVTNRSFDELLKDLRPAH